MSASIYRLNAMHDAGVPISVVHVDRRYIVFGNGIRLDIRLFDESGNPVSKPEDASYYEFGDETFGYGSASFALADFQEWNH